jgi:hypothetical protein
MKQFQHRPKTRAPHGSPIYSARVGAWVTPEHHTHVRLSGGSEYLRGLIERDMRRAAKKAAR